MDSIKETLAAVPQGAQWALAGVGALYLATKVLGSLSLFLNLFILSGTNVRTGPEPPVPALRRHAPVAAVN